MGIFSKISFKGIGKAVSKGVKTIGKQISIKNAIKLGDVATGGQVSNAVGILNALTGKVEEQMAQGNTETAVVIQQQAQEIQQVANRIGGNPTIKELAQAGAGGALTAIGVSLAGTTAAGQIGANAVDSTLEAWFKKNWLKVVGVFGGVVLLWKLLGSSMGKPRVK